MPTVADSKCKMWTIVAPALRVPGRAEWITRRVRGMPCRPRTEPVFVNHGVSFGVVLCFTVAGSCRRWYEGIDHFSPIFCRNAFSFSAFPMNSPFVLQAATTYVLKDRCWRRETAIQRERSSLSCLFAANRKFVIRESIQPGDSGV